MYAPPALSHHAADKFVQLDNVVIIGTSPSFDCTVDSKPPINAFNTMKSRGPRVKGGGHIGFVMTSFTSGPGMAPQFPWHMISNYPAINGITRINSAWFSGFGNKCGRQSTAIMTNPLSPDAMHPTEVTTDKYLVQNPYHLMLCTLPDKYLDIYHYHLMPFTLPR